MVMKLWVNKLLWTFSRFFVANVTTEKFFFTLRYEKPKINLSYHNAIAYDLMLWPKLKTFLFHYQIKESKATVAHTFATFTDFILSSPIWGSFCRFQIRKEKFELVNFLR